LNLALRLVHRSWSTAEAHGGEQHNDHGSDTNADNKLAGEARWKLMHRRRYSEFEIGTVAAIRLRRGLFGIAHILIPVGQALVPMANE
jgi:hypothetical protein